MENSVPWVIANLNSRSLNFDYEENAIIIDPCMRPKEL